MKQYCHLIAIVLAIFGYAHAHGPPFERTDSSVQCATECIDAGFVFCKTDNSRIGTCCNPEECAGRSECSSANHNGNAKYLYCPYEESCERKVMVVGSAEQTVRFEPSINTPTLNSICNYEFRFPESAGEAWGSSFVIEIENLKGTQLTILTGSSIATASGGELEPYRSDETIVKSVYYPESAFLTFQNNGT